MSLLTEKEIQSLIQAVAAKGQLTLNLVNILKDALAESPPPSPGPEQGPESGLGDGGDIFTDSDAEGDIVDSRSFSGDDDDGDEASEASTENPQYFDSPDSVWGRPPRPQFDKQRISNQREAEIRADPLQFVEFIWQNRRFKLKPIGTMDPVPKKVYIGPSGGLYYKKTHGPDGSRLPMSQWTNVYLKDYQRRQCLRGRSRRTRGGLAGYVDGACLNQPDRKRTEAARPPKQTK